MVPHDHHGVSNYRQLLFVQQLVKLPKKLSELCSNVPLFGVMQDVFPCQYVHLSENNDNLLENIYVFIRGLIQYKDAFLPV